MITKCMYYPDNRLCGYFLGHPDDQHRPPEWPYPKPPQADPEEEPEEDED